MKKLSELVYLDLEQFSCSQITDNCLNKERTISYALRVTIPTQNNVPGLIYKECCYESIVLADSTGKLDRNDFNGFWYSRQISNESCDFVLIDKNTDEETELNNLDYGVFKAFNTYSEQPNLTTFIIDWSKVLSSLGEGSYQVKKNISITGIEYSELSPVYTLKIFSDLWADKTIRVDAKMDGFLESKNVNFKGTGFKTSLRVGGFFGRREPKIEQDNIVYRTKKVSPISMKQVNEYQFQTELLPECITEQIFDFILFADDIFMNDYNLNNHSYKYKNFAVKFEKNSNTKYYVENRKARVNLVFQDRFLNRNKYNY